jgi:hypothetical protein
MPFSVMAGLVPGTSTAIHVVRLARGPSAQPVFADWAKCSGLLRIWAEAGVAAADTAMFDIAMPLFETEDVRRGLPPAVGALKGGRPRPALDFQGR